jgi:hypothetical protein
VHNTKSKLIKKKIPVVINQNNMAGVVFVGLPFLIGQAVGICVDVTLVRNGRSVWPFHGLCLGLGVIIGWANAAITKTNGPPTAADYNRVMIMSLFIGLATSFLTYGCFWVLWKGIMSCCCLSRTMRNGRPASRHEVLVYSSSEEEGHGGITIAYADNFVVE